MFYFLVGTSDQSGPVGGLLLLYEPLHCHSSLVGPQPGYRKGECLQYIRLLSIFPVPSKCVSPRGLIL